MNWLIQALFVGGIGLTVSAVVTWLFWLTLYIFDVDKELVKGNERDKFTEQIVEELQHDVKSLEGLHRKD